MICGHGAAEYDGERRVARCLLCGASAPGRYLIDRAGAVTGFRVEAWASETWLDAAPVVFREPYVEA